MSTYIHMKLFKINYDKENEAAHQMFKLKVIWWKVNEVPISPLLPNDILSRKESRKICVEPWDTLQYAWILFENKRRENWIWPPPSIYFNFHTFHLTSWQWFMNTWCGTDNGKTIYILILSIFFLSNSLITLY